MPFVLDKAGGYSRPPLGDKRDAESALKCRAFAAAQVCRTALIPGAVITGKQDERVVEETLLRERLVNLSHAPVDFVDRIAILAEAGASTEGLRCARRIMGVREGHIEEEGLRGRGLFQEVDGLLGVSLGKEITVGFRFYDVGIADERQWGHVVAIWNTEVGIKSAAGGQVLGCVAQVPFANGLGAVTVTMKHVGEGRLVEVHSGLGMREICPLGVAALGVAPD